MAGCKKVLTNNKELYQKLNQLQLVNEVLIRATPNINLGKILNNINRDGMVISCEKIQDYIIIRKHKPFNFNIHLSSEKNKYIYK